MKNLVLILFCLTATQVFSQRFREIVKWEINTVNGGRIIGASISEDSADRVVKDFAFRNKGKKYGFKSFQKTYTTIQVGRNAKDPLKDLKNSSKRGYLVLTPKQVGILSRYQNQTVGKTAYAFTKNSTMNFSDAESLIKIIRKYQITEEEKGTLELEQFASN